MRTRALLITTLLSLSAASVSHAQLLVNGNFEVGPAIAPLSPVLAVAPGNPALTGWTVVTGAVSIVTDNYWVPLSGTRSVALSSTGAGAIEQTFASAPGAVYRLTFWISGEPFSTPTIKHLRVTAGPASQDYTFDVTPAWQWDMFWTQKTLDFTANASTLKVRFASLDASSWGPAVDSAKVELVSAGVPSSSSLSLSAVSPDPARGPARLAFSLASAGHVRLALYDVQGRERARLLEGELGAGPHTAAFDAAQWGGAPGLYLAVLETAGQRLVRRFTVLR
jgi:choice-of-anchor C domain-containing protein